MKRFFDLLSSHALTIWLVAIGIVYYITVAVWAREPFASLTENLKTNPLFIIAAIVLYANITLRGIQAIIRVRKNRKVMYLRVPLISGLIIFLFAFFMSNSFRQFQWRIVGVDDMLDFGKGKVFRVLHIDPALKSDVIRMEGEEGIFSYEPSLTLMDRDGIRYEVGAYPPARIKGLYMHVLQFGIGPGIEFIDKNTVIAKGYMVMRLLPFGLTDGFEIPPFPYRFNLTIRPDRTIKKGNEIAYHYDIKSPLYNVQITKGDKPIIETETISGVSFDDHMRLNFFRPDFWIMLETVKDPFLPLFVTGMALLVMGIFLYPLSFMPGKRTKSQSVVDHGPL